MSMTQSAVQGARWTAISSTLTAGVQFLQLVVLARLLQPSDLGLVAMVTLVLSFTSIYADMGINNAIIQRQGATREELSSLYWLNIIAGCCACLLMNISVPLIISVYDEPALGTLLHASTIVLLIGPFGTQFYFLLQKTLQFKALASIEIARSLTMAMVSIAGALAGLGALSLVIGTIFGNFVFAALLAAVGWRLWRPVFELRVRGLWPYLSFGLYQMGESTLNFFCSRADQLMIGAFLGAEQLGFYNLALSLVLVPWSRINPIFTRVAFPLFSMVQDDTDRLMRGYMTMIRLLTTVSAPLLFGLAATAPTLVPFLYGARWEPSVPLVQVLSFVGLLYVIGNPIGTLLLSRGRADIGFWITLITVIIQIPGIYVGLRLGGPIGVGIGIVAMHLCFLAGEYYFVIQRVVGRCLRLYLESTVNPTMIALMMAGLIWTIPDRIAASAALTLVIQIGLGVFIYLMIILTFQRAWVLRALGMMDIKIIR